MAEQEQPPPSMANANAKENNTKSTNSGSKTRLKKPGSKPGEGWAKCIQKSQANISCDCCPDPFLISEEEHEDLLSILTSFPDLD